MNKSALGLFFGGLLPVIAFTLIEENYGTIAGLIAGMIFGVGEIIFELYKYKKVQKITLIGNGLLLFLGGVSLVLDDGIWFKLQPAIIEFIFAVICIGAYLLKKNLILGLMEQQGQTPPEVVRPFLMGMNFRIGLFFLGHAILATYAAYEWSSEAWAALKGLGLTVSFVFYMILEVFFMRRKISSPPQLHTDGENNK